MGNTKNMLVIGVGGAGLNTINRMVTAKMEGIKYLVMDTDEDDLRKTMVSNKVQLHPEFTSRVDPDLAVGVGRLAVLGEEEKITNQIKSADVVFIIAGMRLDEMMGDDLQALIVATAIDEEKHPT